MRSGPCAPPGSSREDLLVRCDGAVVGSVAVPSSKSPYYYAAGKRQLLTVDRGLAAVDLFAAEERGLVEADEAEALRVRCRELGHGLILVDLHRVAEADLAFAGPGLRQQVYRSDDDTIIVALPEVRVAGNEQTLATVRSWIGQNGLAVTEDGPRLGQMTVRPIDRQGATSLTIANQLHERFKPDLAQARFIRVVGRPPKTPPER
jgi:hypothetical protein